MKAKGFTLIEIVTVLAIIILLASIAGLAVKATIDSSKAVCSTAVIDSLLSLGRATAKTGGFAGVYFYDQNGSSCAMDVIDVYDYSLPYIKLKRVDGRQTKGIGKQGDVKEAVILFSANGRLIIKDVMVGNFRGFSSRSLIVNNKEYYINTYTGQLIGK